MTNASEDSGDKLTRYFLLAIIGFSPVALFLLTWNLPMHDDWQILYRKLSITELGAELIVTGCAFAEGMLRAWMRARLDWWDKIALGALALLLVVAIGTAILASPWPFNAYLRTGFWIVHLLFGLSIAFLCGRVFSAADLTRWYVAGFVALTFVFTIFAATHLHQAIDWTFDLPAFAHIRHIGIYATPIIGLSVGWMARRELRQWTAGFAAVFLAAVITLWTGSRGPFAALTAAILICMLLPRMRASKVWGGFLLAVGLAAAFVAVLPVPASNMGVVRAVTATTESDDVGTGRTQLWHLVIHAIERRPLFGYGEGQMAVVAHFGRMAQPHNLVLQLLLAWGLVGLICAVILAFWFLRRAIPAVRAEERDLLGPALAMGGLLALSMIDAALYHVLPISIFAACAGMVASGWSREPACP